MRISFLLLLFWGQVSWSLDIRPETGSLSYSMVDLVSRGGGRSLYYRRFYNTVATQVGWFGKGYSSTFETRLRPEPDGTLTLFEHGQSPGTVFFPTNRPVTTKEVIDAIIASHKDFKGPQASTLKNKLQYDRNFYLRCAGELNLKTHPQNGETYKTSLFGGQEITFKNGSFVRNLNDGTSEHYDAQGRLSLIHRSDFDQKITLTYDASGRLKDVTDNALNTIRLSWREDQLVEKISNLRSGKAVTYSYEGKFLTSVELEDGSTYRFGYNRLGLLSTYKNKHGVTEISYDKTLNTPVEIKNPDGSVEHWNFQIKRSADKETRLTSREIVRKEFTIKKEIWVTTLRNSDEGKYPLAMSYTMDGREVKTDYRPCCYPQPEKIVTPENETTFTYDTQNRLIRKKSRYLPALEISYDALGRISLLRNGDRQIRYVYGPRGVDPVQIEGLDFLLRPLKKSKDKDRFSVKWKNDPREHSLEYVRRQDESGKTIWYDGKPIVSLAEDLKEGTKAFYQGDENLSKELLARIDGMMAEVDLRLEVSYQE